jgi:hypothetical protein
VCQRQSQVVEHWLRSSSIKILLLQVRSGQAQKRWATLH